MDPCDVFDMLVTRLSAVEQALRDAKEAGVHRDDHAPAGEVVSGLPHCGRRVVVRKSYDDMARGCMYVSVAGGMRLPPLTVSASDARLAEVLCDRWGRDGFERALRAPDCATCASVGLAPTGDGPYDGEELVASAAATALVRAACPSVRRVGSDGFFVDCPGPASIRELLDITDAVAVVLRMPSPDDVEVVRIPMNSTHSEAFLVDAVLWKYNGYAVRRRWDLLDEEDRDELRDLTSGSCVCPFARLVLSKHDLEDWESEEDDADI